MLAPEPDFRYVGLEPGRSLAASMLLAGLHALLALVWRRVTAPMRALELRVPFAIVPWGVLVDNERAPRVLRWAAVQSLHVHTLYGRDAATPSTLWSLVTLRTEHELFAGRMTGAAPLERLLAHLDAYTREQSHRVALDLDGDKASNAGPLEPEFERILGAALELLLSAPSSHRLGLETSYRTTRLRAGGRDAIDTLRAILRDRREHVLDRRPIAAVIAAELGLRELTADLVMLVQSPHPTVAAIAKAAATRLGASSAKVGVVDEVAPFLPPEDVEALAAWIASAPIAARASDALLRSS